MLSSPRARPFAYIERGMRSSIALRWAQNTMRADRRTRIVREMVRPHHSVPFGTAPGQRFLAARCSNICDRMSRSSRRGQLFSSGMMMLIARACSCTPTTMMDPPKPPQWPWHRVKRKRRPTLTTRRCCHSAAPPDQGSRTVPGGCDVAAFAAFGGRVWPRTGRHKRQTKRKRKRAFAFVAAMNPRQARRECWRDRRGVRTGRG